MRINFRAPKFTFPGQVCFTKSPGPGQQFLHLQHIICLISLTWNTILGRSCFSWSTDIDNIFNHKCHWLWHQVFLTLYIKYRLRVFSTGWACAVQTEGCRTKSFSQSVLHTLSSYCTPSACTLGVPQLVLRLLNTGYSFEIVTHLIKILVQTLSLVFAVPLW